jgi:serine-type D-Ala-D-Ala carboxypeptidase (penicillin-binding protein 5/6)
MGGRRWIQQLGLTAGVLALMAGCGESSAPSDDVPALGESLGRVDDAIVEGRYDDARSELDELVATTTSAQEDGDLEGAEADRILAAAAQVMSALPAEEPEPSEPAEPDPAPDDPAPDDSSGEDPDSDEEADEEEELEKEQEELEKEQEKQEEELEKEEEKAEESDDGEGDGNEDGKGD